MSRRGDERDTSTSVRAASHCASHILMERPVAMPNQLELEQCVRQLARRWRRDAMSATQAS